MICIPNPWPGGVKWLKPLVGAMFGLSIIFTFLLMVQPTPSHLIGGALIITSVVVLLINLPSPGAAGREPTTFWIAVFDAHFTGMHASLDTWGQELSHEIQELRDEVRRVNGATGDRSDGK